MPDNEEKTEDLNEPAFNDDITKNAEHIEQKTESFSEPVTVQPVKFSSFENESQMSAEENANLDILMDIDLELTVELGRCELPIKKVLELTKGSIIELDKIAGEPVDLYANGKHIANGEVVVIGDNFGIRVIGITAPEDRLKNL